MGPTYLYVKSFVELSFVAPLLQLLLLRIFAALRRKEGPTLDEFLVRRGLRSRWEGFDV